MSGLPKGVQVFLSSKRKSSILRILEAFRLVESFDLSHSKDSLRSSARLSAPMNGAFNAPRILCCALPIFEMVSSRSLDGRSTVSLHRLRLDELSDLGWPLEDVACLQVVGMVGAVGVHLADGDDVVLQSHGYLRLAEVGFSRLFPLLLHWHLHVLLGGRMTFPVPTVVGHGSS